MSNNQRIDAKGLADCLKDFSASADCVEALGRVRIALGWTRYEFSLFHFFVWMQKAIYSYSSDPLKRDLLLAAFRMSDYYQNTYNAYFFIGASKTRKDLIEEYITDNKLSTEISSVYKQAQRLIVKFADYISLDESFCNYDLFIKQYYNLVYEKWSGINKGALEGTLRRPIFDCRHLFAKWMTNPNNTPQRILFYFDHYNYLFDKYLDKYKDKINSEPYGDFATVTPNGFKEFEELEYS